MSSKIRIGSLIFILLLAAFLTILLCGYKMLMRSLPPEKGRFSVPGIASEVQVYRDGYGIPHIFAKHERDLFLAQGFVTAQDRLWQMDFLRHTARGELSALFGNDASPTDSLMRMSGIWSAAESDAKNLSAESLRMLEDYSQGVNAFLRQNKNRLPLEFALINHVPEPWKPEASIALLHLQAWQSDRHWLARPFFDELVRKIDGKRMPDIPPYGAGGAGLTPDETAELNRFLRLVLKKKLLPPPVSGTLSWAVPSKRSVTGKPLFSIITRNAPLNPSPWYQIRMASGGYQVSGLSLPGFPMVLLGHNSSTAWGWTDPGNERSDVFYRKTDGRTFMEGSLRFFSRGDEPMTIYRLNTAKGSGSIPGGSYGVWHSAKVLVYADTSGRVGSLKPIPFPSGAAPAEFAGLDGTRTQDPYWAPPVQSERIRMLLSQKTRLSLEDMKEIQSDAVSVFALRFLEKIRPWMRADTLSNPVARRLLESLFRWDGSMKSGSSEAAGFEAFVLRCTENFYRDEMGDSLFATFQNLPGLHPEFLLRTIGNPRSAWFDDVRTKDRVETVGEILNRSFREAVSRLSEQWGNEIQKWSWAGLHTVFFFHPFGDNPLYGKVFSVGPFAVGGGATAVLSMDVDAGQPFRAAAGPLSRMLMDLSNWDHSVSVLSPGQSGQPMDAHYQDQVQFYLQNCYHPELWDSTKTLGSGWDLTTLETEAARAGH